MYVLKDSCLCMLRHSEQEKKQLPTTSVLTGNTSWHSSPLSTSASRLGRAAVALLANCSHQSQNFPASLRTTLPVHPTEPDQNMNPSLTSEEGILNDEFVPDVIVCRIYRPSTDPEFALYVFKCIRRKKIKMRRASRCHGRKWINELGYCWVFGLTYSWRWLTRAANCLCPLGNSKGPSRTPFFTTQVLALSSVALSGQMSTVQKNNYCIFAWMAIPALPFHLKLHGDLHGGVIAFAADSQQVPHFCWRSLEDECEKHCFQMWQLCECI